MSKGGIEEYAELELPIGVHSLHEYEPAAFAQILLDAIQYENEHLDIIYMH